MSTWEFRNEVAKTDVGIKEISGNTGIKTNTIMSQLDPQLLQKLEKLRRSKF